MDFSSDLKYFELPQEFNLQVRYNISRTRRGRERERKKEDVPHGKTHLSTIVGTVGESIVDETQRGI